MDEPKKLWKVLPKEEAQEIAKNFLKEMEDLAKKYGVDNYIFAMEYICEDEGKPVPWMTYSTNGNIFSITNLIAWAYGNFRGKLDREISLTKRLAYQMRNEAQRESENEKEPSP